MYVIANEKQEKVAFLLKDVVDVEIEYPNKNTKKIIINISNKQENYSVDHIILFKKWENCVIEFDKLLAEINKDNAAAPTKYFSTTIMPAAVNVTGETL